MQISLDRVVVRRGDFTLRASGIFGPGIHLLTGRIGSGKSTMGEILARVLQPVSGRIFFEGISSSVLSMQFPEYHVTTSTVREEIQSWGADPADILPIAGLMGRGTDDLLTLSRGEMKRLHLACLLAGRYDLMIFDEPFAGLDDEARYWISSRLNRLSGRILIIISHDLTTLPGVDYLWEMQDGVLTQVGPVPGSLSSWKNAPPLIRYLLDQDLGLSGLSWEDLAEAVCRIPE